MFASLKSRYLIARIVPIGMLLMFTFLSNASFADGAIKNPTATAAKPAKRFVNSAKQFEGWWQVERYTARKGYELPADWPNEQVRKDDHYLPVGHYLHMKHIGDGYVPGFYDKNGFPAPWSPSGEMLGLTVFGPFTPDFCLGDGSWKSLCDSYYIGDKLPYFTSKILLTGFTKFKNTDRTTAPALWPDVYPVEYELSAEDRHNIFYWFWIGKDKKTLWLPLLYGEYATVLKRVEKPAHLTAPEITP